MAKLKRELTANVRYIPFVRKMSIWKSIVHALWHCEWKRSETQFVAVYPADAGYDEAPYGASIIDHGTGLVLKLRKGKDSGTNRN